VEGEGGRVVNVSSGSSRARFAAGGEVGGDRIGSREGEAMILVKFGQRVLDATCTVL